MSKRKQIKQMQFLHLPKQNNTYIISGLGLSANDKCPSHNEYKLTIINQSMVYIIESYKGPKTFEIKSRICDIRSHKSYLYSLTL